MKKKKITCLRKLNRFSVLLLACLFTMQGFASGKDSSIENNLVTTSQQDKTVEGKIVDEAGLPLPGVSVLVKGTTTGTTTDVDGVFKLNVPENALLEVTYVGFISQQHVVGKKAFFNIILKEDIKALDEVVVVGYSTQKKADLTGAVASVKMDKLKDMNTSNINSALQGRMSGVTVLQSSGAPGSGTSIRIRGLGTFGNNEPLYIIDGMPSDNMGDINPADIAEINVLKDASSAAIYGSRAANGVVIIQTKKGSKSDKIDITFNTSHGFSKPQKKLKVLNAEQRNMIHLEAFDNAKADGRIDIDKEYIPGTAYYRTDGSAVTRTNWQDKIFSDAAYQSNYDLSLSGGGEKYRFNVMGGHTGQDGTLKGASYKRNTLRVNTEIEPVKGLVFGENLMITSSKRNDVPDIGRSGAVGAALLFDPAVPVWENKDKGIYSGSGALGADIRNPVAILDRADRKDRRTRIFGNVYASYKFLNDFTFKTDFGYDWTDSMNKWFTTKVPEAGVASSTNELTERGFKDTRWLNTTTLQYNKKVGLHSIMVLGGTSYEEYKNDWTDIRGTGFISEEKSQRYMNLADNILWSKASREEWALQSYLARMDYSFADRYLLSASFRADGSSKFSKDNRWGYFPSVSGGWRLSEESFFEPFKESSIQNVKLRASWGQLGNQDMAGSFYPTHTLIAKTDDSDGYNVIFGEKEAVGVGYYESTFANPELKWEVTTQTDLGIDVSFLNHFDFGFDYFIKKSKDVLLPVPIQGVAGVSGNSIMRNAADVKNTGFELNLNYNTQIGTDWTVNAYGNFSRVRNEVTSMGTGAGSIGKSSYRGYTITRISEGSPIGYFYGLKTDGIFRSQAEIDNYVNEKGQKLQPDAKPGDIKFLDHNKDGKISGDDATEIGSGFPDFTYGFGADFGYKNFDLSFFFQGVAGYDILNVLKYEGMFVDNRYNQFAGIMDRFHPINNPNGNEPRVTVKDKNQNSRMSDYYIDKGDYLRLKTLTIGYTLDKKLASKLHLQKARVYASIQNVFTITGYKGYDPELGETYANEGAELKATNEIGVDRGQFPQPRTFMMGININF